MVAIFELVCISILWICIVVLSFLILLMVFSFRILKALFEFLNSGHFCCLLNSELNPCLLFRLNVFPISFCEFDTPFFYRFSHYEFVFCCMLPPKHIPLFWNFFYLLFRCLQKLIHEKTPWVLTFFIRFSNAFLQSVAGFLLFCSLLWRSFLLHFLRLSLV